MLSKHMYETPIGSNPFRVMLINSVKKINKDYLQQYACQIMLYKLICHPRCSHIITLECQFNRESVFVLKLRSLFRKKPETRNLPSNSSIIYLFLS